MRYACIEAMAVAVPRRYLPIEELAAARGVEPAKFTSGLGAREMAVPDPGEDTVALAATAAARLMRAHAIDPATIGLLAVGTETSVDHAKPVASYVQGLLGLPHRMRTFDTQHACYGGTAALMAAADWIASGSAEGSSALVICADVARYGVKTAGEPTQGAAAVAMLVSDRPGLLALDRASGVYSADVHDFWRPVGRRDALVDGHYSISCYLDAVAGAYRMWRERASARGLVAKGPELASDQLARILYHVPFCKMARKAHLQVCAADVEDARGAPLDAAALEAEQPRFLASFEAKVAPGLTLASRVGNTYTASLYLSLASLLHAQGAALGGKRIGLFSYGSGCSSEFYSGVVGECAPEIIARAGIDELLAARTRIDAAEYERIMALAPEAPIDERPPAGAFRFTGFVDHKRTYAAG